MSSAEQKLMEAANASAPRARLELLLEAWRAEPACALRELVLLAADRAERAATDPAALLEHLFEDRDWPQRLNTLLAQPSDPRITNWLLRAVEEEPAEVTAPADAKAFWKEAVSFLTAQKDDCLPALLGALTLRRARLQAVTNPVTKLYRQRTGWAGNDWAEKDALPPPPALRPSLAAAVDACLAAMKVARPAEPPFIDMKEVGDFAALLFEGHTHLQWHVEFRNHEPNAGLGHYALQRNRMATPHARELFRLRTNLACPRDFDGGLSLPLRTSLLWEHKGGRGGFELADAAHATQRRVAPTLFELTLDGVSLSSCFIIDERELQFVLCRVTGSGIDPTLYLCDSRDTWKLELSYADYLRFATRTYGPVFWQWLFCDAPLTPDKRAALTQAIAALEPDGVTPELLELKRRLAARG